jgi:hypothetical protein
MAFTHLEDCTCSTCADRLPDPPDGMDLDPTSTQECESEIAEEEWR